MSVHGSVGIMLSPWYFALASALLMLTEAAKCPKGAFKGIGENDCYLLRTTAATNSDAGDDCKMLNGMLTSVPNAFVNALLASRRRPEAYGLEAAILHSMILTSSYGTTELCGPTTTGIGVIVALIGFNGIVTVLK